MCNLKSPTRQKLEFTMLFVLLLTSCAGAPIAPGEVVEATKVTSLYVIQEAIKGTSQSIRMASPSGGLWMFARWIDEGWIFTAVDMQAKDIMGKWVFCGGGNYTNCKGMADLVEGLLSRGWDFKQVSDLPPGFEAAVATAAGWVSRLHTIPALIIPAESFDIMPEVLGRNNDT